MFMAVFVMTSGTLLTQVLCADSWDLTYQKVYGDKTEVLTIMSPIYY